MKLNGGDAGRVIHEKWLKEAKGGVQRLVLHKEEVRSGAQRGGRDTDSTMVRYNAEDE